MPLRIASALSVLATLSLVGACRSAASSAPAAPPDAPRVDVTIPPASTIDASTAPAPSVPSAPPAASTAAPAGPSDDEQAPARFRACASDADCVAVDRAGCCHNGYREAVAVSQKDAYAAAFACKDSSPICPMFIVRDLRIAKCDVGSRLCGMVKP